MLLALDTNKLCAHSSISSLRLLLAGPDRWWMWSWIYLRYASCSGSNAGTCHAPWIIGIAIAAIAPIVGCFSKHAVERGNDIRCRAVP